MLLAIISRMFRWLFLPAPRTGPGRLLTCCLVAGAHSWLAIDTKAGTQQPVFPASQDEIVQHVFFLADKYFADFRHPETHVLYGARLSTKQNWTSPEDVKAGRPKPWGYGSRIADTALHCGHVLVALLDAYEARPDPFLKQNIKRTFAALKLIGSLPETYPKAGKPALAGLVPRGPHPDDPAAWYDDSSMDQHTTFIISLARYADSSLASEQDRQWIRQALQKTGRRLERYGWSIRQGDGRTQAHVGFAWTGFNSDHASILLPTVKALHQGTGDTHWLETYENFLAGQNGRRWQQLHPGPHVRINGHPIYANQNAFRIHALFHMETDAARKAVLRSLLKQTAQMQWQRDFPGPFYRRFHSENEWVRLREQLGWNDADLHGGDDAWNMFRPEMLDSGGLPVLAHVRFPLGGVHMLLLSEHPELIRQRLGMIWDMLTTVDLKKIGAGETNYLFTVVALHTYAFRFRHPDLFVKHARHKRDVGSSRNARGTSRSETVWRQRQNNRPETLPHQLPIVAGAGIGPTMDVAVSGTRAFAIGRGQLSVFDITDPATPRLTGKLTGLGHVRQIIVHNDVAFVTAREDGLFIIDVTDSRKPRLLNHYDTVEFATGVDIAGNVLFVACRHFGVELIDVSRPDRPQHLSTVRTGEAQSVVARGKWLYVGVWATSEVVTVNVGDPRRPKIVSRAPLDGYGDGVDVRGQYLYAATGHHGRNAHRTPDDPGYGAGHGLELFDVSEPAHPRFISRVKFPRLYNMGHDMWSVTATGRHVFIADTHNGIFVVDVSDPQHPVITGHRDLPAPSSQDTPDFAGGLAIATGTVYAAGGATDLHILAAPEIARPPKPEITEPPSIPKQQPASANQRFSVYQPPGQVHSVDLFGDRAVVACGSAGAHVIQLRPSIQPLSELPTAGFVTDVATANDLVLLAAGHDGLLICRLSEQGQLSSLGRYQVPGQAIRQVEGVMSGNRVYALLQAGANNLHIVDITSPATPQRILNESHPGLLYGDQLMRGLAEDRYACVFWHVSGLHWYDMASIPAPVFSGNTLPLRIGAANGLVQYRNRTLATLRGGYVVLDRDEHRPLTELPVRRTGPRQQNPGTPTIFGNRLYAANRATGIVTIVDISSINRPKLIEQFDTEGNPARIHVHARRLVIPNGYSGLLISLDEEAE